MNKPDDARASRRRISATTAMYYRLMEISPEFRDRTLEIEHLTRRRMASGRKQWKTVTIPVVVHVVYHFDEENISDEQVTSQIESLNRDFSATNPDRDMTPEVWRGLIVDSGIRFSLAKVDPAGKPTSGITRTKTDRRSFSVSLFADQAEPVKSAAAGGVDPWPSDKYLNIWVATLEGGILGYAQFPGGPPKTDGIVMLGQVFGTVGTVMPPFHLGRSTTHEMGHWLNLFNIYGTLPDCYDSDRVDDTPVQASSNYGKPSYPHISCDNGPNGDMFMNFMDFVDDDAMCMFTAGQVERMRACLQNIRSTFLNA